MKVKVYPGPFCKTEAIDEDGFIEVEEGATVADVINRLRCPFPIKVLGLYMVNYEKVKSSFKLKDGDIISIITPIAGG